jgi:predicted SnoaL-like aldol condensation-catalyzing enzyme
MIDIFRKKDATAVDRYFGGSFIQHDPNLAEGLAGLKSFAAEVASSPAADITIYRTLVDGDLVLLHSRYQGVGRYGAAAIAFDLFRFEDGKIVEHWGDRSRRHPLIRQVARKSTVPLRCLIVRRRRPIGPWCGHTGRQSWSHCASIASKLLLTALAMRSTLRRSGMELLGDRFLHNQDPLLTSLRIGGVPVRAADRDCDLTRHATSSSLPVVLRLSMSACAIAAFASGYSPPIRTLRFPSVIQSNSCAERARSSSGVWMWSKKIA